MGLGGENPSGFMTLANKGSASRERHLTRDDYSSVPTTVGSHPLQPNHDTRY